MAGAATYPADTIERRAMFALSFEDPVTGLIVRDGIEPLVEGLKPPLLTSAGWFAWRLDGPPVAQKVTVDVRLANPMYDKPKNAIPSDRKPLPGERRIRRFRLVVDVKANDGKTPPAGLHSPFVLSTTPGYVPPDGTTAAVGRVVTAGSSPEPLGDVKVTIELKHDGGTGTFASKHVAVTDERGEFAAVVQGLNAEKPDPALDSDGDPIPGTIDARLKMEWDSGGGSEIITKKIDPPLRLGRLNYLAAAIEWKADPPP